MRVQKPKNLRNMTKAAMCIVFLHKACKTLYPDMKDYLGFSQKSGDFNRI